jgi:hypothetical protein
MDGSNGNTAKTPYCSLWYVSYLFVVIRYVHLLLHALLSSASDNEGGRDGEENGDHATKRNDNSHSQNKDPNEVHYKMIKYVLCGLAGFVCSAFEHDRARSGDGNGRDMDGNTTDDGVEDDDNDPYTSLSASRCYQASHMAAFAVESLLRIDGLYSRKRPAVLPLLWKCMGDIVSSASTSKTASSPTVVRHAVQALLSYLNEGADSLQTAGAVFDLPTDRGGSMSSAIGPAEQQQSHTQQLSRQQCQSLLQPKILSFLLARLAVFLPLVTVVPSTLTAPAKSIRAGGGDLAACFGTLARLRCALLEARERILVASSSGVNGAPLPLEGIDTNTTNNSGGNNSRHHNLNLIKSYAQLSRKVENLVADRVLVRGLVKASGSVSLDGSALDTLSAMETASLPPAAGTMASNPPDQRKPLPLRWAAGQAFLLLRVLESTFPSASSVSTTPSCESFLASRDNVELSLRTIHALIFDVLPSVPSLAVAPPSRSVMGVAALAPAGCIASELVSRFLAVASDCLLRCETAAPCLAASSVANPGRAWFHQWLLSWLAPSAATERCGGRAHVLSSSVGLDRSHPLTSELALSLLHLQVAGLLRLNEVTVGEEQPGDARGGVPILDLVVQLLFHPRTETGFRRLLACFLARLIADANDAPADGGSSAGRLVSRLIRPHAHNLEQSFRCPKKRKRGRPGERLQPLDLDIVLWLLSMISLDVNGVSQEMDIELASLSKTAGKVAADLQLAAFRVSLSTKLESLRTDTGTVDGLSSCLVCFTKAWNEKSRCSAPPTVKRSLYVLGSRVFERVRTRCERLQHGVPLDDPLADHMYHALSQVLLQHNRCHEDCPNGGVAFLLVAVRALASVGSRISLNSAQRSLLEIARGINQLLLPSQWTIRSFCLSSVISFAQALPAAQRSIVVRSVPESCHKLLLCRKQNLLLVSCLEEEKARYLFVARSLHLHQRRWKRRSQTNSTRLLSTKWSRHSTTVVEPGSYLMIMPTQEGRQAIVIFPPCPESLRDIRFMIGICDEDGTDANEPTMQSTVPSVMQIQAFTRTLAGCCKISTHQAPM